MSVELLDKTRTIGRLLQGSATSKVVFGDVCEVLSDVLSSDAVVISGTGKILGIAHREDVEALSAFDSVEVGERIDAVLDDRFLGVLSTNENVNLRTLGLSDRKDRYAAMINPIGIAGERLGTLFVYRNTEDYSIDDIIVSEYAATVVALAMMHAVDEENAEEKRQRDVVRSALSALSFSETEAMIHIFDELQGTEGILVASRVADRIGITRSVIVNALRKIESAGVIESRSSGMKGTYIKVLNEHIFGELEEIRKRRKAK